MRRSIQKKKKNIRKKKKKKKKIENLRSPMQSPIDMKYSYPLLTIIINNAMSLNKFILVPF